MSKALPSNNQLESDSGVQSQKPYEAPRVISRERLESAANVCTGFGQKAQPDAPSPGGGVCGQSGLQS